jgi:predicted O-methyltransferase YrrM
MEFIDEKLDAYCCAHTTSEREQLKRLNRETHVKILQPRMLSGAFQGRFLSMIAHLVQPKRILEIGTYTGYSALCFLEGLHPDGKITTIDINEELEDFVRKHIAEANATEKIDYLLGDATNIIPGLNEAFDLVFIDADKDNYLTYYELVFDKVKKGGYILADNVLWSGKVTGDFEQVDFDTQQIMKFNARVQSDDRVENILLPIRDGLMLIRKK